MKELSPHLSAILRRLYNKHRIGGKHTEETNVFRWAKNLSREEQEQLKDDWEYCIKQLGWVLRLKKTGENHVSLNPKMLKEILNQIKGDENGI